MSEVQQSMKIFTIISQIEQFLEESPRSKLGGGNKHVVDIDKAFDLLGDLKVTIPEDIRRANSVLIEAEKTIEFAKENADEMMESAERESERMIHEAEQEAQRILEQAQRDYEAKVAENEVYLEATRRAEQLQQRAEINANIVYNGAKQYADDVLKDLQRYFSEYHELIGQNRRELGIDEPTPAPEAAQEAVSLEKEDRGSTRRKKRVVRQEDLEQDMEEASYDEEEEYEEARDERPRGIKGWFKKHIIEYDEDEYDEDEEEYDEEEEEIEEDYSRRGKRARLGKRSAPVEMDADLDE